MASVIYHLQNVMHVTLLDTSDESVNVMSLSNSLLAPFLSRNIKSTLLKNEN